MLLVEHLGKNITQMQFTRLLINADSVHDVPIQTTVEMSIAWGLGGTSKIASRGDIPTSIPATSDGTLGGWYTTILADGIDRYSCNYYCDFVIATCGADMVYGAAQFVTTSACLSFCSTAISSGAWVVGDAADTGTNSLSCRINHIGLANALALTPKDKALFCSEAGVSGKLKLKQMPILRGILFAFCSRPNF